MVRDLTPGRLYFGRYYLRCYIVASAKSEWECDSGIVDNTLTLATDYPFWIQEASKQFFPQPDIVIESGFEYQYDYEYEYASDTVGTVSWPTDHFASSEFLLIIYGPCSDPRLLINGYPYQEYDVLENNELHGDRQPGKHSSQIPGKRYNTESVRHACERTEPV